MDLSNISDDVLLDRTSRYARSERKITHIVLWHINEVERRRLYAQLGYSSIFKYISQHLGYGEKAAYERMHASRLLGKMPHLSEKIEEGTLNLTQVVQVQSCINKEERIGNKVDFAQTAKIFEKIECMTGEKTLKTLAIEFNQPIQMHEVIQPQRDNTVRAGITFTDEEMDILKHVKDLLSHSLSNPTWAELIVFLAKKQIKTIEGKPAPKNEKKLLEGPFNKVGVVEAKAKMAVIKSQVVEGSEATIPLKVELIREIELKAAKEPRVEQKTEAVMDAVGNTSPKMMQGFGVTRARKAIKTTTRRKLMAQASKCCEYVNPESGKRCDGVYQLQIDHKIPVALGGSNSFSNLRVLCRTHNLLEARKLGLKWVRKD